MRARYRLLALAAVCSLTLGARMSSSAVAVTPLDGGQPVVRGVHVLALAVGSGGTIYAGGREVGDAQATGRSDPGGLGSVLLVSHDHGAHWTKRMNEEPPPGFVAHYPAWTDRTRWPANFSVYQIVVDPRRPSTIYAAGGLPFGKGSRGRPYLLLRSTDAGHTWAEILVRRVDLKAKPPLVTNIVVTPANRQDLTYRLAARVLALVIDPRDSRRLYAGTDALGVLRSADGGSTWQYVAASPSVGTHTAEHLVIDPQHPATLYSLVQDTTVASLYRSDNGGTTWQKVWQGGFASGLSVEGQAIYMARLDGIYMSSDHGVHWQLLIDPHGLPAFAAPTAFGAAGMLLQALHDPHTGSWNLIVLINSRTAVDQRIYVTYDGGRTWHRQQVASGTNLTFTVRDMEYGYKRLWIDNAMRLPILFASREPEGLYSWNITR